MAELNAKQLGEVKFWRDLHDGDPAAYDALRRDDCEFRLRYFPELRAETGRGLDYGCGLSSIFEYAGLDADVQAYDPLMAEYQQIRPTRAPVSVTTTPTGPYDFIACFNVVDHDPSPTAVLDDIWFLLKNGGRLYFEVNFDPELFEDCHYALWGLDTVREQLDGFTVVKERVTTNPVYPEQILYEGLYVK